MRTIALAISHTPWIPERVVSMQRVRDAIGEPSPNTYQHYREFTERAPNYVWSQEMWCWAYSTGADDCLFLQDDVVLAPNFWPALRAMLSHPHGVIGLESVHPGAMTLARNGQHAYTTCDGLIGVGYVIPGVILGDLGAWLENYLKSGAEKAINEDSLINVFSLATETRIWHPCPTIIDHDTSIRSTYSNDEHSYRRPSVTWRDGDVCGFEPEELERPEFWATKPVHLGLFYQSVHRLACAWSRTFSLDDLQRVEREEQCPARYARFLL